MTANLFTALAVAAALAGATASPVGPPTPAHPTAGHLELYVIAAVAPGVRTDARVEAQGCDPAPTRYEWSLSTNARLLAQAGSTVSVIFTGPDGNRGRNVGAIDVRAKDGPCAGLTAHAAPLLGPADPNLYNPALDAGPETVLATTPAPGVTPSPGVCLYVPPQALYYAPGLASSGKLEVQVLGASEGCPAR